MSKVYLLVLGSVCLLPLAAQAMEEGDGWDKNGKSDVSSTMNKGKEKEKENKNQRPQLTREVGALHFSQVTGIVRKKPAVSREKNKAGATKPSNLQSMLEQAQGENERFVARMENLIFVSSEIESILYPPCQMKRGIPIRDLYVTPKQGDEVIRIIKHATHPVYAKKFFNKVMKGKPIDPQHMEHYTRKAMINKIPDSVYPKAVAYFDGVVIGNYEGTTVQTKNKQQGSNDYQGKVLAFKLGLEDEKLGNIDLLYPNKDDMGNQIMLPVKMTSSITYNEENK
jgi:hypothetical protein